MQQVFQNSINNKVNKTINLLPENLDYKKLNHIYKTGKIVYLYDGFNFDAFTSSVKIYLHNVLKLDTKAEKFNDDFIGIQFNAPGSLAGKVNIQTNFIILFLKINNILYFDINVAEKFNKNKTGQSNLKISSLLNDSHKKEITRFIYETVHNEFINKHKTQQFNFDNLLIEETHLNERVFIKSNIDGEKLLAKLNLSSLKISGEKSHPSFYNSSFVLTDKTIFISAYNKQGECILFEEIDEKIEIKKRLTKNSIHFNNLISQPKRSNSKLFNQIKGIQDYTGIERIREVAGINYNNKHYKAAIDLISEIKQTENNAFNDLILLIIRGKKDKTTLKNHISESEVKEITHKILLTENAEKNIIQILNQWQVSYNEKTFFLELFSESADNPEDRKKILPLYEIIRTEFKKKNKDLINQTVFDIKFAEFLISSGKKRRAIKILKNLIKHLPDETISDVLPAKNLDLSGSNSGQLLKIKILSLLTLAKGKSESEKEIQKSTQLQPLNTSNLHQLSEAEDTILKNKATEIISLLRENGLNILTKEIPVKKYKQLPENILNTELRHPATLKKGSFYSVQKWVSKIKADDYSSVKEYAEKIEYSNHPKLYEIFENVAQIFNIEEIEFFISRGEKSQGIIGYEGKPPFIIIGQKHLDKESELFLNFKELQFSVAVEIAHIFYKHSRISSNDVWRGVADKGSILLDALLGIVPAAGIASKSIQNSQKLSRLTGILKSSSNQISNGKNIYDSAIKLSNYYSANFKTSSKTEKEQKLLAVSRLMQYTADRAGISVAGDIKSAVRAIFLTGKYNYELFEDAKKTALKDFLLKVNNDNSFKHQDLALRVAHLFSFYISDEYSEIRKLLNVKG